MGLRYPLMRAGAKKNETLELDDLDLDILRSLNDNARKSFRDIAKELHISLTTVSNRVKAMERAEVIQGYIPVLDATKLGYDLTALIGVKVIRFRDPLSGEILGSIRADRARYLPDGPGGPGWYPRGAILRPLDFRSPRELSPDDPLPTTFEPIEIELALNARPRVFLAGLTSFCRYAGQGFHEVGIRLHVAQPPPVFSRSPAEAVRIFNWLKSGQIASRALLSQPARSA